MNKSKPYKYSFLSKYLEYSEASSTFLRWKVDRKSPYGNSIKAGDEVKGTLNSSTNTLTVIINGKIFIVYRVIYCLYHKIDIPENMVIDHIDGNRRNNSIENLQLINHSQNMQKRKVRSDSKSGFKGIYFNEKLQCYTVGISAGNERRFRDFYLKDYSDKDLALKSAIAWRHKMEDEMHEVSERNPVLS